MLSTEENRVHGFPPELRSLKTTANRRTGSPCFKYHRRRIDLICICVTCCPVRLPLCDWTEIVSQATFHVLLNR